LEKKKRGINSRRNLLNHGRYHEIPVCLGKKKEDKKAERACLQVTERLSKVEERSGKNGGNGATILFHPK